MKIVTNRGYQIFFIDDKFNMVRFLPSSDDYEYLDDNKVYLAGLIEKDKEEYKRMSAIVKLSGNIGKTMSVYDFCYGFAIKNNLKSVQASNDLIVIYDEIRQKQYLDKWGSEINRTNWKHGREYYYLQGYNGFLEIPNLFGNVKHFRGENNFGLTPMLSNATYYYAENVNEFYAVSEKNLIVFGDNKMSIEDLDCYTGNVISEIHGNRVSRFKRFKR
jgi:hypothetical protein